MSKRRPHNTNAGYVTERKVKHPIGGYVVIYHARTAGIDADTALVLMHEPSGYFMQEPNRKTAYKDMNDAAVRYDADFWIAHRSYWPDETDKTRTKWGVWCVRSGFSMCGPAEAWLKESHGPNDMRRSEYATEAEARAVAEKWNGYGKGATTYCAKPIA